MKPLSPRRGRRGLGAVLGAFVLLASVFAQAATANLIAESQTRFTETGPALNPAHTGTAPRAAIDPATGHGFAVYTTTQNGVSRVVLKDLDATAAIDPRILNNPGTGRHCISPDIAFAPEAGAFVAVYVCDGNLGGQVPGEYELVLNRIGTDGTVGAAKFVRVGPAGTTDVIAMTPRLAWAPAHGVFLVAYRQTATAAPGDEIHGITVTPDLATITAPLAISAVGDPTDPTREASSPAVSYNAPFDRWLVAWSGDPNLDGKQEIGGQRVTPAAVAGGQFALTGAQAQIAVMTSNPDPDADALEPSIVAVPDATFERWVVAFAGRTATGPPIDAGFEIFARPVTGSALGTPGRLSAHGFDAQTPRRARTPDLAYNAARSEVVAVWRAADPSLQSGQTEIFGGRFSPLLAPVREIRRLSDMRGGANTPAVVVDPVAKRLRLLWSGTGTGPGAGPDEEIVAGRAGIEDVLGSTGTLTEVIGDGDGFTDPGETVDAAQMVQNTGDIPLVGLGATAAAQTSLYEPLGPGLYPDLQVGAVGINTVPVRLRLVPTLECGRGGQIIQNRFTGNGPIGVGGFNFTTGRPGEARDLVSGAPVAIPNGGTVEIPIEISSPTRLKDLDVLLDITHPDTAQLTVGLKLPTGLGGSTFNLFAANSVAGANLTGTIIDTQAAIPIAGSPAPHTGAFRTTATTASFDGVGPVGTWTLVVSDAAAEGSGTVDRFGLRIRTAQCVPPAVAIDPVGDVTAGTPVTLHGSASDADGDSRIVTFDWDLDNDGTFEVNSAGADQAATYADAGTHTVRLRVADDSGESAVATTTVNVTAPPAPPPPGAAVTPPLSPPATPPVTPPATPPVTRDLTPPGARIAVGRLAALTRVLRLGIPFTWTCTEPGRLTVVGRIAGALARSVGLARTPRRIPGRTPVAPKPFAVGFAAVRCVRVGSVRGLLRFTGAAPRRLATRALVALALTSTARDTAGNVSRPFRRPVVLRSA